MEIRHFIDIIGEDTGSPFARARLIMIRKACANSGLIESHDITPEGAAWLIYTALGAPSSAYNELLTWLTARRVDRTINEPGAHPVDVIRQIITNPSTAAQVQALAVHRPSGVLTVLSTANRVENYPMLTAAPFEAGQVAGMMGRSGIARALEALTCKTFAHA